MEKYKILQTIGRGNFGVVYLCSLLANAERKYVMKQISMSELSLSERDGALQEVQLLADLNHPFIVGYKESWLDNTHNTLYIIMSYCESGDLTTAIKQRTQQNSDRGSVEYFKESQILDWFVQLCLALRYCHNKRIIHRDLKSQNVFLTKNDTVRLGDFGIARVLNGTSELAMSVVGTPYSMSPEVCENKPYSYSSDIWSLGCVLYEMCTLKHAFDANNLLGLVWKIVQEQYVPIPSCFSSELNNLVSRMLQKNPQNRPTIDQILTEKIVVDRLQAQIAQKQQAKQNKTGSALSPASSNSQAASVTSPTNSDFSTITVDYKGPQQQQQQQQAETFMSPTERLKAKKLAEAEKRKLELTQAIANKNNPHSASQPLSATATSSSNFNASSTSNLNNTRNSSKFSHTAEQQMGAYNSYNNHSAAYNTTMSVNTASTLAANTGTIIAKNNQPAERAIKSSGSYNLNASMSPAQIQQIKQNQQSIQESAAAAASQTSAISSSSSQPRGQFNATNSSENLPAYNITSNSGIAGDNEDNEDYEDDFERSPSPTRKSLKHFNSDLTANNNNEDFNLDYSNNSRSNSNVSYSADNSDFEDDEANEKQELNELQKTLKNTSLQLMKQTAAAAAAAASANSANANNNNSSNINNVVSKPLSSPHNPNRPLSASSPASPIQALPVSLRSKLTALKDKCLKEMTEQTFNQIYLYLKKKQQSPNPNSPTNTEEVNKLSKSGLLAQFGASNTKAIFSVEQYIFYESLMNNNSSKK